jgi:hypothetical protein
MICKAVLQWNMRAKSMWNWIVEDHQAVPKRKFKKKKDHHAVVVVVTGEQHDGQGSVQVH